MKKTHEERLAVARAWKARNKERCRAMRADYYTKNKVIEAESAKKWRLANPQKNRVTKRVWAERNKAKLYLLRKTVYRGRIQASQKNRYRSDPLYRQNCLLQAELFQALRIFKEGQRPKKIEQLIGCSVAFLFARVETLYGIGPDWKGYHLDHIVPRSKFNLLDPVEAKKCYHYTNLQLIPVLDHKLKTRMERLINE